MNRETTAEANAAVQVIINRAIALGPQDPLTKLAYILRTGLGLATFPTIILIPPVTIIMAILVTCTFGLLLLPLSALWLLFLGFLMGSSWLWIKIPVSRPLLIIPGVLLATLAGVYVSLVPDMGEKYQKVLKMGMADTWPYSFLMWKINLELSDVEGFY